MDRVVTEELKNGTDGFGETEGENSKNMALVFKTSANESQISMCGKKASTHFPFVKQRQTLEI